MQNSEHPEFPRDKLLAQLLLSLQEEDDNPYDISEEMLVAYAEGKLSPDEVAVVQRCLVHNQPALANVIELEREARRRAASSVADMAAAPGYWARIKAWLGGHQGLAWGGLGSAVATSFAVVMMFSGSVYKDLDAQFDDQWSSNTKPLVNWQTGVGASKFFVSKDAFQMKGAADDHFLLAYREGVRKGLTAFAQLSPETAQSIDASKTAPSTNCNGQLPGAECSRVTKAGRYLGQWVALAHVTCAANQSPQQVADWFSKNLAAANTLVEDGALDANNVLRQALNQLEADDYVQVQCQQIAKMLDY